MPAGAIETKLAALFTLADTAMSATVLRNEVVPVDMPASGIVIMRDGSPGDYEITLPLTHHYDHQVEFEIYTQGYQDRQDVADARKQELGAAIAADRTLGGLCDFVDVQLGEPDDQPVEGGEAIRFETVVVTLSYGVTNPLA